MFYKKLLNNFKILFLILYLILFGASACSIFHEPGFDLTPIYSRILKTDYNTGWTAVLDALGSFERAIVNREAGVIQTAWIDSTATHKELTEPFGESQTFLKSKYRISVTVAPGTYRGKPSVKVSIQKELMVQYDPLDSWKPVKTDGIEENTMLYRITRLVKIKHRLNEMEEERLQQALKSGS